MHRCNLFSETEVTNLIPLKSYWAIIRVNRGSRLTNERACCEISSFPGLASAKDDVSIAISLLRCRLPRGRRVKLSAKMKRTSEGWRKAGLKKEREKRKRKRQRERERERSSFFNWRWETGKILTYPNDIRKSRGVGGEERQQEPPRSHFRFRSAPPSLPPAPPTPPPPPAPPTGACASLLPLRLTPLENKMRCRVH